jgi:hypothetical protein
MSAPFECRCPAPGCARVFSMNLAGSVPKHSRSVRDHLRMCAEGQEVCCLPVSLWVFRLGAMLVAARLRLGALWLYRVYVGLSPMTRAPSVWALAPPCAPGSRPACVLFLARVPSLSTSGHTTHVCSCTLLMSAVVPNAKPVHQGAKLSCGYGTWSPVVGQRGGGAMSCCRARETLR